MKNNVITSLIALVASSVAIANDNQVSEPLQFEAGVRQLTVRGEKWERKLQLPYSKHLGPFGNIQPLVPVEGVHHAIEMDIVNALNNPNVIVLDTREQAAHLKGTIPGSINIPYTEIAARMDELGCTQLDRKNEKGHSYDCSNAKTVYGFCSGPVCPQTSIAIKATIREGFPSKKWYYYRGGMLTWEGIGLPIVEGSL